MGAFQLLIAVLAATVTVTQCATTCMYNQVRGKGAPPATSISQSLHKLLSMPKTGPCSGVFNVYPDGTMSNTRTWFTGSLAIEVTKETLTVHVGEECLYILASIIHTCIEDSEYWGGNATSSDVKYAIYNSVFPKDWTPSSAVKPSQKPSSQPALSVKESKPGLSWKTSTRASRGASTDIRESSKQGALTSSTYLAFHGKKSNSKNISSEHHGNPYPIGTSIYPVSSSHHVIPHEVPTYTHAVAAKAPTNVHHAISHKTPTHGVSGKKPTKAATGNHHPVPSHPAKAAPGNAKQQSIYATDASIGSRKNITRLSPITTGIIYKPTGPASSGSLAAKSNKFRTQTLSGVTGAPSSFSQITTTDSSGHSTVLPIWFGPLGAGIVIVPDAAGLGGVIPPPPGYLPLEIGPDGQASRVSKAESQSPRDRSTLTSSSTSRPSITSSSRLSSTSSSSLATTTSVPLWLIFPKNRKDAANSRFTTELTLLFGRYLYTSQNGLSGVVFWRAPLNSTQRTQYNASALVSKRRPYTAMTDVNDYRS